MTNEKDPNNYYYDFGDTEPSEELPPAVEELSKRIAEKKKRILEHRKIYQKSTQLRNYIKGNEENTK